MWWRPHALGPGARIGTPCYATYTAVSRPLGPSLSSPIVGVRPLALYNDSELGMASLLAYQSPGAVSPAGRADLSPADAGDQPHRPAVGGSCYLLCNRCSPTAVHPPGALGPWLPRTLACGDRPALHAGRCGLVWTASLDRVWVQRQQTGWVALGADQMFDPARAERLWLALAVATLWTVSVGCQADATQPRPDLTRLPERHIARQRASQSRPSRSLSCFRRGRLMIVAALCTEQALPLGQVWSEPWPQSPTAHDDQAEEPVQRSKAA